VARKRQPQERKLRTRERVLADLSINYVERQALLRGFAVNRMTTDYGIDLLMRTYGDGGEVESGHVLFQVKATDSLQLHKDEQTIAVRVEVADLKAWQDEWMPVILVVYDGRSDNAYCSSSKLGHSFKTTQGIEPSWSMAATAWAIQSSSCLKRNSWSRRVIVSPRPSARSVA
jgi:hypothetical protein